ncbi:hypothetical protein A2Z33_00115 [Candidatus Gottesmanbacteria bacterium RBG_16_52_11]|uniref:Uncharacterized protein n=1 Tax=Candidatus Gottesmanbacteria bacterium RBG_16_52_11 TaxID=1798374 RepID=A0A1F5YN08_9BACT|nr:MAG: hypothetical protein A2Z33_00115 [Candidatus Gottesmanbacteria bacterium RBG_16_52_11]
MQINIYGWPVMAGVGVRIMILIPLPCGTGETTDPELNNILISTVITAIIPMRTKMAAALRRESDIYKKPKT